MDRLKDKRALITNGTSQIGMATARRFADEGALVMVTGASSDLVDHARNELKDRGAAWCLDVGLPRDHALLARRVSDFCGALDVVFINLSSIRLAPMDTWDEAAFDHEIGSNVKAPFFLLKTLLPLLAKPSSVIVNTTIAAHASLAHGSVFAAGRAGLVTLVRNLAVELIGKGVRVNLVSPGLMAVPALQAHERGNEASRAAARLPARRLGEPVEIADAVVYLASDESMFTIGTELVVDGGMALI
jgi:NAD(P)-dependent dehydrogenase (short-subunit alcohol dehydrogenase family)